jgi:NAD(P) transhydrogenase subunit beta
MIAQHFVSLSGLFAAALFIFGLKRMASPVTALSGIMTAGAGMIVAVIASFLVLFELDGTVRSHLTTNLGLAIAALLAGGGWAWWRGARVEMTAMPRSPLSNFLVEEPQARCCLPSLSSVR